MRSFEGQEAYVSSWCGSKVVERARCRRAGVSWIVRRASALRTHHNEERRVYSEPKAPLVLHEERVAEIIERVDLALRLDRVPEAGDGLRASVNPCWLQDICESVPS